MDQNMFMGLFIAALVVILGLATAVTTLIVKPILKLNTSINNLNNSVSTLNKSVGDAEKKIEKNSQDIDELSKTVFMHEGKLCKLEGANKI